MYICNPKSGHRLVQSIGGGNFIGKYGLTNPNDQLPSLF